MCLCKLEWLATLYEEDITHIKLTLPIGSVAGTVLIFLKSVALKLLLKQPDSGVIIAVLISMVIIKG
jgi:hypothetical protein